MTNDPRATRAGRLAVSRRRREASLPAANWPRRYGSREPAAGPAAPPAGHDTVPPGSVPVSAIILARDEQVNIDRAVRSAGWCEQVVVVDSGSTDATRQIARAAGAEVWEQPWRGFAAQREWAMRAPGIRHDWVFFLDADEWVPVDLAAEIAARLGTEEAAGYTQRRRLVFLGRWIAHCGWYSNSWQARLLDRRRASFADAEEYGERASVDGPVRRLAADLVDEDGKGLADWLRKHVRYAELEAARRLAVAAAGAGDGPPPGPLRGALAAARAAVRERARSTRPLTRTLAKEVVLPLLPARPLAIFVYMYALRQGWRDGRAGLAFCLYHAWYALTVEQLVRSMRVAGAGAAQVAAGGQAAAAPAPGGQAPVVAGLPTQREPADARIEPGRAQAGGDAR
ncbi:MAG: glycosyltransferase family 2 protein, partial [Frankia sp.]|nr:glycosyltransferase family 2 protein [Frankia sp.]